MALCWLLGFGHHVHIVRTIDAAHLLHLLLELHDTTTGIY